MGRYIGLLGIAAIIGIALLISTNRKAINLRIVGAAFALQALVAVFVIYSDSGKSRDRVDEPRRAKRHGLFPRRH